MTQALKELQSEIVALNRGFRFGGFFCVDTPWGLCFSCPSSVS
jgi:hypothetical protein